MKLRIGFAVCAYILVLSACGLPGNGSEARSNIDRLPSSHMIVTCTIGPVTNHETLLLSVLRQKGVVLASAEDGLYRASLADKQWTQLVCPDTLPVEGYLSQASGDSEELLYNSLGGGLFISNDAGLTWHLVSDEYDFGPVFLHRNGTLYTIVNVRFEISEPITNVVDLAWHTTEPNGDEYYTRDIVLMSKDMGQNWKDITGPIGAGVELYGIGEDPDHPDLVILAGNCIRNYILQASDETYDWKMIRVWDWRAVYSGEIVHEFRAWRPPGGATRR